MLHYSSRSCSSCYIQAVGTALHVTPRQYGLLFMLYSYSLGCSAHYMLIVYSFFYRCINIFIIIIIIIIIIILFTYYAEVYMTFYAHSIAFVKQIKLNKLGYTVCMCTLGFVGKYSRHLWACVLVLGFVCKYSRHLRTS